MFDVESNNSEWFKVTQDDSENLDQPSPDTTVHLNPDEQNMVPKLLENVSAVTDGNTSFEAIPVHTWKRRYFARLVAIALVVGGIYYSTEGLFVLVFLFIAVVPFEKMFPRHVGQKTRRPEIETDMSYALASPVIGIAAGVAAIIVGILSLAWIPGLLIRPYVAKIPDEYMPIVGVLLFDMTVYWTHRFYHEIPFLWKFHAIHHSTKTLDWASGFRGHPFDGTLIAPAFVFLIVAGFSPELTGTLALIQVLLGLFLHANVRWRLRPLHKLIITPEFHHWHHTNEADAIWTNYSTFLPIWDLIFGTYFMPKDRRPQIYGVDEHIPAGMAEQLLWPLKGMRNPLWILRHPFKAIAAGFRFAKLLIREMWRSATRKRGSKPQTAVIEAMTPTNSTSILKSE